jgi:uncharacterized protein involved in exopolysaccharide biosynthesis
MNEEIKNTPVAEEDEIDLIALAKNIWNHRKLIIKTLIGFTVLGVIVALLSPTQYTVTTRMVPHVSGGSSPSGGLSSLASMAGINFNLNRETAELSPLIYPQIVQSVPFQLQLMKTTFSFPDVDHPVSLFEYYTEYSKPGIFSIIKKYTLGLPGIILKALRGENKPPETIKGKVSTIKLTEEQEKVRKIIAENVTLTTDEKEGHVTLNASFHEASLAAAVAHKAQELLQEYITKFKIKKASARLDFIKERYHEKKKEFEAAQARLAAFRDKNKNVTSAMALTEQEQLENEYRLAFDVYSNLAQQLEEARIKEKEDTPVFSIIQPVTIPLERSKPNRLLILIIWIFLGGIISIGWIFARQYIATAKKRWIEIEEETG